MVLVTDEKILSDVQNTNPTESRIAVQMDDGSQLLTVTVWG